jgi:hypothetical protein
MSQTLGWSLLGDKQMWLLILAEEAIVSASLIVYFVIPECINSVIINEML